MSERDGVLIGLDIGTTSTKCGAFNTKGKLLAFSSAGYSINYPSPGWAEQDPNSWWDAVKKVLNECISRVKNRKVLGITVSGQAPTLVVVDKKGKPLRPAILWMDNRSVDEVKEIESKVGERVPVTFFPPKILWVKNKEPEVFKRAYKMLGCKGYIYYKFTGEMGIDVSYENLFLDPEKKEWRLDILEKLGIPDELMPKAFKSGELVGHVTKKAANETKIPEGTPVFAGGPYDMDVGEVGLGLIEEGTAGLITGTSAVLLFVTKPNTIDLQGRIVGKPSLTTGKWKVEGIMSTAGGALEWYIKNFADVEQKISRITGLSIYTLLEKEIVSISPGADGLVFLPHLSGERAPYWSNVPRGVFLGLTLRHTKQHMLRAVYEGVAYHFRLFLEIAKEIGIPTPKEIRASGGMANSNAWLQIISDVLGVPIKVPSVLMSELLGDAIIAAVSLKIYPSLKKACDSMITFKKTISPDTSKYQLYNEMFNIYKSIFPKLKSEFEKISELFH